MDVNLGDAIRVDATAQGLTFAKVGALTAA